MSMVTDACQAEAELEINPSTAEMLAQQLAEDKNETAEALRMKAVVEEQCAALSLFTPDWTSTSRIRPWKWLDVRSHLS